MNLESRIAEVTKRIERAALSAGRDPHSVTLVAVSKRQPADVVREAYRLGMRHFGENYAQELLAKAGEIGLPDIAWHMIGHLQTNKARLVAPLVSCVHSVDSTHLATELGKRVAKAGRQVGVFVEVNVAKDDAKSGCRPAELAEIMAAIAEQPSLQLRGLMTMPPYDDDPARAAPYFAGLRALQTLHGGKTILPELSMGMSHDLEVAIAEGATFVRVGAAIFGERRG